MGRTHKDLDPNLLRPLARKAYGMSGADIERLIREARGKARREQRQLCWDDIERLLDAKRPNISKELRWRMAVHEAGHAIAHLILRSSEIVLITIDHPQGGLVQVADEPPHARTETAMLHDIGVCLAGRTAEIEFLGVVSSGAGGSKDSDLAQATKIAVSMETEAGFGKVFPLLYRKANESTSLMFHLGLAEQVHARLQEGERLATQVIRENREAVEVLAGGLVQHLTLEGSHLTETIVELRKLLVVRPGA
jgi:ATP-dependent Zn protease